MRPRLSNRRLRRGLCRGGSRVGVGRPGNPPGPRRGRRRSDPPGLVPVGARIVGASHHPWLVGRGRKQTRFRRGLEPVSHGQGVGAQALGHANPGSRVDELYGLFPALREKRRAPASSLSGGQRKMLGIAKALAAEPRLLVMDEPSAGLSPLFVKEVIRVLSDLRRRGLSLLIAEQNIGFLDIATRVFVLEGGRIRFSGTVAEMTDNDALRRAYFGLK